MAIRKAVNGGWRLREGVGILAAAKTLDTAPVKDELSAFAGTQRTLGDAQARLDAADDAVAGAKARVAQCDREQDRALDLLARCLVADGEPWSNTFAAYGVDLPPNTLAKLPPLEEAKVMHGLVDRIKDAKDLSKAAREAAIATDKAATKVEEASAALTVAQAAAVEALHTRKSLDKEWDEKKAALRLKARHLAEMGSPQIYTRLFPRKPRANAKAAKAAAAAAAAGTRPVSSAA